MILKTAVSRILPTGRGAGGCPGRARRASPGRWLSPLLCRAAVLSLGSAWAFGVLGAEFKSPAMAAADLAARLGMAGAPVVVDVRRPIEFKAAHVPGAVNIPHTELVLRLDEVGSPNGVVLYCIAGQRTRQAEATLLENGIEHIYHLKGGLSNWVQGGHAVQKGAGN